MKTKGEKMNKLLQGNNKFILIGAVVLIGVIFYIMPNKNASLELNGLEANLQTSNNAETTQYSRPALEINESAFKEDAFKTTENKQNIVDNSVAMEANNTKKETASVEIKPLIDNNTKDIPILENSVVMAKQPEIKQETPIVQPSQTQIETTSQDNAIIKQQVEQIKQLQAEIASLKTLIAELRAEISQLKSQNVIIANNTKEVENKKVVDAQELKRQEEERKAQEELEKRKIAELEKLQKELNFYKPELKIINGKMEFESVTYRAGDVFLGRFKIEQISKNTIRFSRNGQAYNLRF